MANGELLYQALENIIRNAVKFTSTNSDVTVSINRSEYTTAEFIIQVCDQGPGVDDSVLDSLFDPFVRTSEAREHDSGGFGIGLAIAKRAIDMHGGSITATNRVHGGLSITIHLPCNETG